QLVGGPCALRALAPRSPVGLTETGRESQPKRLGDKAVLNEREYGLAGWLRATPGKPWQILVVGETLPRHRPRGRRLPRSRPRRDRRPASCECQSHRAWPSRPLQETSGNSGVVSLATDPARPSLSSLELIRPLSARPRSRRRAPP